MGYLSVYSACYVCQRPFMYNPLHVPSVRDDATGRREPVCSDCMERTNAVRVARGLDPHPIHPDAYVGEPEENVPYDNDDA